MVSSDGNILLTTHRLVDRTEIMDRQVMLKDILSCEVCYRKQTYYKVLTWTFLFIFIAAFLIILIYNKNCAAIPVDHALTYLSVPALFLLLSVYSLFAFTRAHIRVTGKFRMLDLDIHAFKRDTIKNFMAELKLQSGNRKKEQ